MSAAAAPTLQSRSKAVDLAPKGRDNEAQADGLGLDDPQLSPLALKGRDSRSAAPRSLEAQGIACDERYVGD